MTANYCEYLICNADMNSYCQPVQTGVLNLLPLSVKRERLQDSVTQDLALLSIDRA